MFENQQREDVEAFLDADPEFRRLYQQHRKLDSKVHDATSGVLPMDSARLAVMKRQKLQAKERLQRMWDTKAQRLH
jgi:uncharacterized protein YdcH (DUF465 family)